jgi:hypothetical protein
MGVSRGSASRLRMDSTNSRTPREGDGNDHTGNTGSTAATAGVHPERVVAGAHPERGLVLAGVVTACRPAGGGWEARILTKGTTISCRLPDMPVAAGDSLIVTVLDPPYFAAGGAALETVPVEAVQVSSTVAGES